MLAARVRSRTSGRWNGTGWLAQRQPALPQPPADVAVSRAPTQVDGRMAAGQPRSRVSRWGCKKASGVLAGAVTDEAPECCHCQPADEAPECDTRWGNSLRITKTGKRARPRHVLQLPRIPTAMPPCSTGGFGRVQRKSAGQKSRVLFPLHVSKLHNCTFNPSSSLESQTNYNNNGRPMQPGRCRAACNKSAKTELLVCFFCPVSLSWDKNQECKDMRIGGTGVDEEVSSKIRKFTKTNTASF